MSIYGILYMNTNQKEKAMATSKKTTTVTFRNAGKPFSDKATSFLYKNAGLVSTKTIAKRLGRTEKAIRRKAEKLGLSLSLF